MLVGDGNSGNTQCIYDYRASSGDFDIRIDLDSYYSESSSNGSKIYLDIRSSVSTPTEQAYVGYYIDTSHTVVANATINSVDQGETSDTIAGVPSRLRVTREGNNVRAYYYYAGSWTQLDAWNFSAFAANLAHVRVLFVSNPGGQVLMDDLKFVDGCPGPTTTTTSSTISTSSTSSTASTSSTTISTTSTTATLSTTTTTVCSYNEEFTNLDDWQINHDSYSDITSVSGKMRGSIDYSHSAEATADYLYAINAGDFDIRVDLSNEDYEQADNGIYPVLYVGDDVRKNSADNCIYITAHRTDAGYLIREYLVINGVSDDEYLTTSASLPQKLRITRVGTILQTYYYNGASWVAATSSHDFTSYAALIDSVTCFVYSYVNGGHVDFDNLTFRHGCPTGTTIWTTSSTTTSTTTTTSTIVTTTTTIIP